MIFNLVYCFTVLANKERETIYDPTITITSDFLNLNNHDLSASFKGAVTIIFNDIIVKTDFLKIYYVNNNNKKSIDRIEIPGNLKAYKKHSNEVIVAESGEYIVVLNKLTLKGNVNMQKDNHILVTNKMIYFTKLKAISKNRK